MTTCRRRHGPSPAPWHHPRPAVRIGWRLNFRPSTLVPVSWLGTGSGVRSAGPGCRGGGGGGVGTGLLAPREKIAAGIAALTTPAQLQLAGDEKSQGT